MLNLLNNSNNYSLLDNNLLSYGIIIGSVSIIGFSLYYFSGYLFKNSAIDNISTTSTNNVEKHYAESATQTDDTMLYDYLNERIMENMTPSASSLASNITPTEFIREYEVNPHFTNYIDNIVSWSDKVTDNAGSARQVFKNGMNPTTPSEHLFAQNLEFLQNLRRMLVEKFPLTDLQIQLKEYAQIPLRTISETVGMTPEELNLSLIEYSQLQESIRQVYELGCF